jgi:hypothetical protein
MQFFVTNKYRIVDPSDKFKTLSEKQKGEVLWGALDIYEKYMGRAEQSDLPEVVVRKILKSSTLGTITL